MSFSSTSRWVCWRSVSHSSHCRATRSPTRAAWMQVGFAMISPGLALLRKVSFRGLMAMSPRRSADRKRAAAGWIRAACLALSVTALIDLRLFRARVFRAAAAASVPCRIPSILAASCCCRCGSLQIARLPRRDRVNAVSSRPRHLLRPSHHGPAERTFRCPSDFRCRRAVVPRHTAVRVRPVDTPYGILGVAMFVRGFGGGSITIPSAAAAYSSVPRESLGHATTSINICQRFGGPTGSAGLAIFLQFALLRAAMPNRPIA